jgi:hypothetical protein
MTDEDWTAQYADHPSSSSTMTDEDWTAQYADHPSSTVGSTAETGSTSSVNSTKSMASKAMKVGGTGAAAYGASDVLKSIINGPVTGNVALSNKGSIRNSANSTNNYDNGVNQSTTGQSSRNYSDVDSSTTTTTSTVTHANSYGPGGNDLSNILPHASEAPKPSDQGLKDSLDKLHKTVRNQSHANTATIDNENNQIIDGSRDYVPSKNPKNSNVSSN